MSASVFKVRSEDATFISEEKVAIIFLYFFIFIIFANSMQKVAQRRFYSLDFGFDKLSNVL